VGGGMGRTHRCAADQKACFYVLLHLQRLAGSAGRRRAAGYFCYTCRHTTLCSRTPTHV
jgi:hypothetical protein